MNSLRYFLLASLVLSSCQTSSKLSNESRTLASTSDAGRIAMEKIAFGGIENVNTDALIVMKDGKIVYQRYARGYSETTKHLSWSMGKSIAGMIAAQAIDQNKFSLSDPLSKWVPAYEGPATLLDVFHMSSGIDFKEEYSGVPVDSDATRMLYLSAVKSGFADYTARLPKRAGVQPGDHFYYSSGDSNLIMETLKKSVNFKPHYDNYPWIYFFSRLGIDNATFEQDAAGTFVGSSYIYMTPVEYARVGQLLANRGKWNQDQIVPTWYFDMMSTVAPGVMKNALPGTSPTRAYSMQTTTNLPISGRGLSSEYPDLPEDALLMIGYQGQLVIASPSENLVIVRLATDKGAAFTPYRQELFGAIHKFLEEDLGLKVKTAGGPLPPAAPPKAKGKTNVFDYTKVPHLIRALYAKELCSCRFVLGRTQEQCKEDLKLSIPIFPFSKVDVKNDRVKTTFVGIAGSKAVYRGPRLGCTLVK